MQPLVVNPKGERLADAVLGHAGDCREQCHVAASSPEIIRRVVVLPQPDVPSSTTNSPSLIVKSSGLTAWRSPIFFFYLPQFDSCHNRCVFVLVLLALYNAQPCRPFSIFLGSDAHPTQFGLQFFDGRQAALEFIGWCIRFLSDRQLCHRLWHNYVRLGIGAAKGPYSTQKPADEYPVGPSVFQPRCSAIVQV